MKFLVCYDYGMGGLWATVEAPDPQAIVRAYPELTVFEERQGWMTDEFWQRQWSKPSLRLESAPVGVFAAILGDRANNRG